VCDLVVMNPVVINKKTKKGHFYRILSQFEKHTQRKNQKRSEQQTSRCSTTQKLPENSSWMLII